MEAQLERPKFRTDLVAQPLEENGQLVVEVIDPDSGGSFRFYEVEYYVASAMNGERNVAGLRDWALSELGVAPGEKELDQLVRTLADLGYLDAAGAAVSAPAKPAVAAPPVAAPIAPPPVAPPPAAPAPMDLELGLAGSGDVTRDRPAASADPDFALGAPGVAGGASPEVADAGLSGADFDLGVAGKSDIAPARPTPPAAPDVELGLPGKAPAPVAAETSFEGLMDDDAPPASVTGPLGGKQPLPEDFSNLDGITPPPADVPVPSLRPVTDVDLDEDGPTNLPPAIPIGGTDDEDVSVDLSAHLDLGVDDVKEAVRQSKVMNAVEIPADLMAELEGAAAPAPAASEPISIDAKPKKPAVAEAKKDEAKKPKVKSKADLKPKSPTFPLPEPPTSVKPVEPPDDKGKDQFKQGGSSLKWLVAVLLLVALAAGGYLYYDRVYSKKDDKKPTAKPSVVKPGVTPGTKPGVRPGVKPTPVKPPPAKPPVAAFSRVEAQAQAVNMPKAAVIDSLADEGAQVAEGDVVATLAGAKRIEKKIASIKSRRDDHYGKKLDAAKKKLDEANAANNKAQVRNWTAKVKQYEAKVASKTAAIAVQQKKLDELALKAPVAGTVKRVAKVKAWVAKDKPVVEIAGDAEAFATFAGPMPKSYKAGDAVSVHAEADAQSKATCTVREAAGDKVTVDCPDDVPFKAGDKVVLQ